MTDRSPKELVYAAREHMRQTLIETNQPVEVVGYVNESLTVLADRVGEYSRTDRNIHSICFILSYCIGCAIGSVITYVILAGFSQ